MNKFFMLLSLVSLWSPIIWGAQGILYVRPPSSQASPSKNAPRAQNLGDLLGFSLNTEKANAPYLIFDSIGMYDLGLDIGISNLTLANNQRAYDNSDGTFTIVDEFLRDLSLSIPAIYVEVAGQAKLSYQYIHQEDTAELREKSKRKVLLKEDQQELMHWAVSVFKDKVDASPEMTQSIDALVTDHANGDLTQFRQDPKMKNLRFELNRLGVSPEKVLNLKEGDIISMSTLGDAAFGITAPFNYLITVPKLGLDAFIRSTWRLSVLREKDNLVTVKVQRIPKERGYSLYAQYSVVPVTISGVLFGSNLSLGLVPFRITYQKSKDKIFDSVYSYDLTTPCGLASYSRALMLDLRPSQKCVESGAPGVKHLYERLSEHLQMNDNIRSQVRLSLGVLSLDRRVNRSCTDVKITDDSGDTNSFKCMTSFDKRWNSLLPQSHSEKRLSIFSGVTFDSSNNQPKDFEFRVSADFFSDKTSVHSFKKTLAFVRNATPNKSMEDFLDQIDLQKGGSLVRINLNAVFSGGAANQIFNSTEDQIWVALALALGLDANQWSTKELRDRWVESKNQSPSYGWCPSTDEILGSMTRCSLLYDSADKLVGFFKKMEKIPSVQDKLRELNRVFKSAGFHPLLLNTMITLAGQQPYLMKIRISGDAWPQPLEVQSQN